MLWHLKASQRRYQVPSHPHIVLSTSKMERAFVPPMPCPRFSFLSSPPPPLPLPQYPVQLYPKSTFCLSGWQTGTIIQLLLFALCGKRAIVSLSPFRLEGQTDLSLSAHAPSPSSVKRKKREKGKNPHLLGERVGAPQ